MELKRAHQFLVHYDINFWQIINTTGILTPEAELKGQDFTQTKKNQVMMK
jgi:hypothetical protein